MDLDCVVVGGGAAGLSAALVLGRARRNVLIVDAGVRSNLAAHGMGGILGHDGLPPDLHYQAGWAELAEYPSVDVRPGTVTDARPEGYGLAVTVPGGEVTAKRLLLATGMEYVLPDLPEVRELWGGDVFPSPFCHGWELRDRPLAVLGSTGDAFVAAGLLQGWSDDVVLLTDGPATMSIPNRVLLVAEGIAVDERKVMGLRSANGRLEAIRFADGSELPRKGLMVHAPLRQRSGLAGLLGCEMTAAGTIVVDERGATTAPGVYAAGDAAGVRPQVAQAIASGASAAATIVHELVAAARGFHRPAA